MAETEFVLVDETEINDFLDSTYEAYEGKLNTQKQICFAINRLSEFATLAGKSLGEVESLEENELDQFLSRFFISLKKADGSLYTKKSIFGIKYGVQRHFKKVRDIDISKTDQFHAIHGAYRAMMMKLKKAGKGIVIKSISNKDMAKIVASDAVDVTTPLGLQNKVFMDIMIYFTTRGHGRIREMKVNDFIIETDNEREGRPLRYIAHRDMLTKSRPLKEIDDDEESNINGYMYEIPGSSSCPVSSFQKYKAVLNPALDCMWQRPLDIVPADGPWFMNSPLGINTLGKKMRLISQMAGCSRLYNNHCLRSTTMTVLDRARFNNRDQMCVTARKSESSLKRLNVSSCSDKTINKMSKTITVKIKQEHLENAEPTNATPWSEDNVLMNENLNSTESQEQLKLQDTQHSIQDATSFTVPTTFTSTKMKNRGSDFITTEDLKAAYTVVQNSPLCIRTPMIHRCQQAFSIEENVQLHLKLENSQTTGSFKVRGLANQMAHLPKAVVDGDCHVITMSAGNYGKALSYAANKLGIQATVLMPKTAPDNRAVLMRGYGSKVVKVDVSELQSKVDEKVANEGMYFCHPFDDLHLIAGHGSVGLEVLEDVPNPDIVLVCCGGGGLLAGTAAAIKLHCQTPCRVYGVEPKTACTMFQSRVKGDAVTDHTSHSIAAGLSPPYAGKNSFAHNKAFVDDILLVSDSEIISAVKLLYKAGLKVEPSGAAAFSALMHHKVPNVSGKTVVVVITGGNVSPEELANIFDI